MNIIPFDGGKLPAYLKKVDVSRLNSDLTAHAGGGFPVISIKGKVFAVVRDGERKVLPNPKDPDSPATAIEVVILKANGKSSKVFYLKGYDPESSEGQKPDCYSNDGEAPAADAKNPQAKKCATCAHNQWGSRITEKGSSKGKACADAVRVAVAPAGQLNDPMLLRVPPASIRNLGEYGQMLDKRGVAYQTVITRVGFDMEADGSKLTFKALSFLGEDDFAEVQRTLEGDAVRDILGRGIPVGIVEAPAAAAEEEAPEAEVKVSKSKTVTDDEVKAAVSAAEKPKATKVEKKEPATVTDDLEIDLDGISFDD